MKKLATLLCVLLVFTGCEKEPQSEIDEAIIVEYMAENGIDADRLASGLYIQILDAGIGVHPNNESNVTVHYTGILPDGTVIDDTRDDNVPNIIDLASALPGWREGVPMMRKEGHAILLIPSHLGYGSKKQGDVPKNSVLIFDIELLDFI